MPVFFQYRFQYDFLPEIARPVIIQGAQEKVLKLVRDIDGRHIGIFQYFIHLIKKYFDTLGAL